MSVIVPTVLSENTDDFAQQLARLNGITNRIHIDIADGEFAPTFTISANDAKWPTDWIADIHAMVARPSEHAQMLAALKPNMIIFHAEVQEDLLPIIQWLKSSGIKAGIALQKTTVPSTIVPLIQAVDHVMIFSGDLGKYGGTASLMQLEKVRLIKAIRQDVEIGWDGGITVENVYSLTHGGVDILNVGSAIAKADDPAAAYKALVDETNRHSVI